MKKIIFISFLIISLLFANMEKNMVKITFNNYMELHELVEMGIDFDHHRTMTEVHAFVTNEEFEKRSKATSENIQQTKNDIQETLEKSMIFWEKSL